MEQYRSLLQAGDFPGLAALGLAEWCRSGSDDYLIAQLEETTRADLTQGELEQPNPEQWDLLGALQMPTTVIAAELDPPESLQASLDLADRIPGAALVRLEADHLPQYREPESVAAVVLDTLARVG